MRVELLEGWKGTRAISVNDHRMGPKGTPWEIKWSWEGTHPLEAENKRLKNRIKKLENQINK